jgi:hypothetical protein
LSDIYGDIIGTSRYTEVSEREKAETMATQIDGSIRAHAQAVHDSTHEIVVFLRGHLGGPLTALLAGVDSRTIARWATDEMPPRETAEKRLRSAYQVFRLLEVVEASPTIRAWFMGMNPQLDDLSPAEAIAKDQYREVMSAARAFASGE